MSEQSQGPIVPGARVRDVHNPGRTGLVTNSPPQVRPSGLRRQVLWDDRSVSYEYEGSLELVVGDALYDPYDLLRRRLIGRADDLRRNLTFVHLTGRLANLVYAMGITNTDFYPHQYKPLLTFLDSPSSGLLIADEVGLGKTIEAGLIWTELRARFDKRRLLVVCPPVLREKWCMELRHRFGVTSRIVNADDLLTEIRTIDSDQQVAWVTSYHALRPPRGWRPEDSMSGGNVRGAAQLCDHLYRHSQSEPLFDMVILDEAHYVRNQQTTSWRLAELLRDSSEYQLMLSATPINLRNDDLFSLLTLLDPDHFSSLDDLNKLISANRPLVLARDAALDLRSSASTLAEYLKQASAEPWLRGSQQLKRIMESPPTDQRLTDKKYRSELADSLERMNLLSHVLTRTRKRDVQERRIERIVFRHPVAMSAPEKRFYAAVTEAIREYAARHGISDGFLLAMPQRQVTSCPAALLASWLGTASHDDEDSTDGIGNVDRQSDTTEFHPLRSFLKSAVPPGLSAKLLESNDSKFELLRALLTRHFAEHPDEKVVLFTTFRATAKYVHRRLTQSDIPCLIVWGGQADSKYEVLEEFRRSSSVRVLVSTEVAAEGVDLQFCRMLVNYDLPWNPTRVEQRIGRIDRLGQTAERIFAWNFYFQETIDDRVVTRLLERLRTFEEALGETEAVVGEVISKLEYELLSRPRSPEEEVLLIDKAALALEVVARQRNDLEANSAHMMAHGQQVLERIAAAQALSRFVTDRDLFVFVRDYLVRFWPGHAFVSDATNTMAVALRLPSKLTAHFDAYIKKRGAVSQTRLATGQERTVIFHNKITERSTVAQEVIHQFHPLISFIADDLRDRQEQAYPLVAVQLETSSQPSGLPYGRYAFFAAQWSFRGVHQEERLVVAAVNVDTMEYLDRDASDVMLQSARIDGVDWPGVANELPIGTTGEALEKCECLLDALFQELLVSRQAENADRAAFQLDSIDRHELRRVVVLQRIEDNHRIAGRGPLVAATQGQRRVLLEKLSLRREQVRQRKTILGSSTFVCAGIVKVH